MASHPAVFWLFVFDAKISVVFCGKTVMRRYLSARMVIQIYLTEISNASQAECSALLLLSHLFGSECNCCPQWVKSYSCV